MNQRDSNNHDAVKIIGIDFTEPFDLKTFSGSSYHIWTTLKERGALVDAFTPRPSGTIVNLYKLLSFQPGQRKWRANWRRSVAFRKLLSSRAERIIRDFTHKDFNATLQIGAYYNIADAWSGCKTLLADNNCAITQKTNITFRSSDKAFRRQFEFEKDVYRSMDRIFAFSSFLADSFVEDFGCDSKKVEVVHAGINIDESLLSAPDKDYNSKIVLFSAFDFENKGGQVLLKAFEHVIREVPDARLVLLGPAPRSFPDSVTNHGPLSKSDPAHMAIMSQSFKTASVFVHPTLADAFPNVIREAMAARLPCIASRLCGIPDMVEDGVTGFLVPLNDANALAEKLIVLLQDPDRCRRMGEAGYRKYRNQFTWGTVSDKIVASISKVLSG